MKKRKVPMRKCVASQEMKPKNELFRIVRSPEGEVFYDPTGKKSGRGTYLSKDKTVVEKAMKQNILARHLNAQVPGELYTELTEALEKEQQKTK